jgi:uncharacterized protein Veg
MDASFELQLDHRVEVSVMIVRNELENCRKDLEANIGKNVRLRSSGGRKRTIVQEGILESCYPNIFTVRCNRRNSYQEMVSFSYVDVLTHVVEVAVDAAEEPSAPLYMAYVT